MSNIRKIVDPDALLMFRDWERRREQRRFERALLVGALVVAVLAAVAGWWLYLAGHGCAGGAA